MLHGSRRGIIPLALLITALFPLAGRAQVVLAPGEEFEFTAADTCGTAEEIPNLVDALAGVDNDCDAAGRRIETQVRPIFGAGWVGLQTVRSSAFLRNSFEIDADSGNAGHTVGAWISYDVDFSGLMVFVGFFSNPTVELAITLRDLTENKEIKGELIWARDGSGVGLSVPYIPIDLNLGGGQDERSVSNTFGAVLTRGHTYRIELRLVCAVFSDGGLDIGSECDYMGNTLFGSGGGAGWSRLAVKVGLDEVEVLAKLAEIDELRELFENHTHTYLTGKGVGHNNTEASTSAPLEVEDGDGEEDDGDDDGEDDPPPPGHSSKPPWWPWKGKKK